ncbi:MAG: hypothetical protein ACYDG6_09810, partial [Thermincolia bacterium]
MRIKPWLKEGRLGTWYVSKSQLAKAGLTLRSKVFFRFGATKVSVVKKLIPEEQINEDELYLSMDLIRQLNLPQLNTLGVFSHGNQLILGPVIGIFVSPQEINNLNKGKGRNSVYQWFWRVSRELGGLYYFFSLTDIFWDQQMVKGWIFVDSEGAWVARVLPLPNVIYDRCFGPYGRAGSYKLRAMLEEIPDVK